MDIARTHVAEVAAALERLDLGCLERIAALLHGAHRERRTVYCMGNGGSAATASHLAADLARLTCMPERDTQLKVLSLNSEMALLTATANDLGFEQVFVDQLRGRVGRGDVVVGVSTSGASSNVLRAVEHARAHGAGTVGLTGLLGEPLRALSDEALVIQSTNVQVIEDVTMVAAHILCLLTRGRRLAADD